MSTSRQFLVGFVGLGVGLLSFLVMTAMAAALPNSRPPAWVEWAFQGTVILGFAGTVVGGGLVLVALGRTVLGWFR